MLVKPWWIAIAVLAAASPAHADRCEQGLALAESKDSKDLPRASLYLESCKTDALSPELADKVSRARAAVAHALDNSKLSALSIVTTPEGLVAETDALPGERFTTPATIWAKAGDYTVSVALDDTALDAGKGMTTTASLDAFSRRTVILNVPVKKATPKDGKVDFNDETPEQTAHKGPPPAVKHGTMMPKKYLRSGGPSGPLLDDPFATRGDGRVAWRLGARIGGGMFVHGGDGGAARGAAFTVAGIAARPLDGPLSLATRLSFAHRDVDAIGLDVGLGVRLAHSRSLVLTASGALRGEVRVQDELAMQPVSRVGVGAAAELELALLSLPLTVGLRVEPSFTELLPGARNHSMLLEVGYDWR